MPAVHRKPSDGGLLGNLNARAAAGSRAVDNFASIQTYYRRASLLLRQVSAVLGSATPPAASGAGRILPFACRGPPSVTALIACRPTCIDGGIMMTSCTSCSCVLQREWHANGHRPGPRRRCMQASSFLPAGRPLSIPQPLNMPLLLAA